MVGTVASEMTFDGHVGHDSCPEFAFSSVYGHGIGWGGDGWAYGHDTWSDFAISLVNKHGIGWDEDGSLQMACLALLCTVQCLSNAGCWFGVGVCKRFGVVVWVGLTT